MMLVGMLATAFDVTQCFYLTDGEDTSNYVVRRGSYQPLMEARPHGYRLHIVKAVIMGDTRVGKSTLSRAYVDNVFEPNL